MDKLEIIASTGLPTNLLECFHSVQIAILEFVRQFRS